jgi:tRNA-dihydrouridine synthase A
VIAPKRFIQVAPMMGYTNRHCRYFLRTICKNAWLFTEMITAQAILHGNPSKLLDYHSSEHPISLQLGGSNPHELAAATKIASAFGYDEINLNIGCPSSRVQSGKFGACLMAEPQQVADCVDAMQNAAPTTVSVKTRVGIDTFDSYAFLHNFINTVAETGCKLFIIHARKAWLTGLSPKQNREIPDLEYEKVYRLKRDFPHLTIILNGGVQSVEQAKAHLKQADGVMFGRAAYQNPYLFSTVDQDFYGKGEALDRETILERLIPYFEEECAKGTLPSQITRHWLGLLHGTKYAKRWRRLLTGTQKQLDFKKLYACTKEQPSW